MTAPDSAPSRAIPFANLIAAAPDFALAGLFGISWVAPYTFGPRMLPRLELMMLMEFIILHSSAFLAFAMAAPSGRVMRLAAVSGLGLFYTLFVGSFSLAFHTWWPFVSFWTLLLNRMLAVLLGETPREGDLGFIVAGWAVGVASFLGYAMLTSFAQIPRLGITAAVQAAQPISGGGLWADEPWRVIAFGAFYYATIAISELLGIGAPGVSQAQRPSQS